MYQSLYRKYRPKTFSDVVGQEHITTTLKNEVADNKQSHAYLFTGSRGTGKTTCSKILAKAVNCPNQKDGNPCCECNICIGIEEGTILDVLEIDAASNNGVDNIRDLREEANFTPAVAKYRVYIIDEAHMLSTGAFNALLKIMEEPPAHVLFILATTEVNKVPATILSRCQRFDFKRIENDDLKSRLKYVATEENINLADDAAMLIARLSDGGMRDALSLLDLCWANNDEITVETVTDVSGIVGRGHLLKLDEAIALHDTGLCLSIVDELNQKSLDAERLLSQLISHYRDLMIVSSVKDADGLIIALPSDIEELKTHSNAYNVSEIIYILSVLGDSLNRINRTTHRRTELEMALVKVCNTKLSASTDALLARIEKLEATIKSGVIAMSTAVQEPRKVASVMSPTATSTQTTAEAVEVPPPPQKIDKTAIIPFKQWLDVMARLEKLNGALYGALNGSKAFLNGDILLIDCKNTMFLSLIRDNEMAKQSIKQAMIEATGKKYRLGPYNENDYEVKKEEKDPLDDFINGLNIDEDKIEIK